MKQSIFKHCIFILLTFSMLLGCKKDDVTDNKTEATALTRKVNGFIKDVMSDVYLWSNNLPDIDLNYETDSKAYFNKLLYKDDKWSYITDNVDEWENSLNGIEKAYGYSLTFGRFVDSKGAATGNYFAIVEYVYPDTPAQKAGFIRGSVITQVNGANITTNNYMNLISSDHVTATLGNLSSTGISNAGTVSMTAEELNLDPVLLYKVIEKENHKIGYLFYAQFIENYNPSLQKALEYFKSNQITDLIVDLRYNLGGQISAAKYLCSSIAPLTTVNSGKTLATYQWNDKYQNIWTTEKMTDYTTVTFDKTVPVQLGLNKVTILTGRGTASASELTITGLQPHMNVEMVGDTTSGKYTASITIKPEDIYQNESSYSDFKNWGIQPIVLRYANANGVTNFKDGFAPTYLVTDELLPAQPLGDLSEPLLKKAVENITGVKIAALKSATQKFSFKVFDRRFSKFDPIIRNMPFKPDQLFKKNN